MSWLGLITTGLLALCALIETFTPNDSPENKGARILDDLLRGKFTLPSLNTVGPKLSTGSSALTVGPATVYSFPKGEPAQVIQGPPEQDQQGLP